MLQRYAQDELVASTQNGFSDLLDWLEFLRAKEYLVGLLRRTHGLTEVDAARRCVKITPHVRMASAYIRQSLDGPPEISFLPAYYAILNLMKVYVLLGPRHGDLSKNRWHGATYDPQGKDSRSVITEEIKLKSGGVFPLFYETLTGGKLPAQVVTLRVGEFLGCVSGIWYEYSLASGLAHPMCQLRFDGEQAQNSLRARCVAMLPTGGKPKGEIQALRDLAVHPRNPYIFYSPGAPAGMAPPQLEAAFRTSIKAYLLYRVEPWHTYAAIVNSRLEFPQELPIALLFFYMSSIVRYRPEYFARLRDSKYWPVISSARVHAFLEFLLCFWSFAHKRNYFINAPLYNLAPTQQAFPLVLTRQVAVPAAAPALATTVAPVPGNADTAAGAAARVAPAPDPTPAAGTAP